MHISIHQDFKNFVEKQHSRELYLQMLGEAGIEEATFESHQYHNDSEMDQLIGVATRTLSRSRMDFLCDMGAYSAGPLMEKIQPFLEPSWDVLDLIENTETRMHKYVREEIGAFPPALKTQRISDSELQVDIMSHRNMAGMAKGFIVGFADYFGDTISVDIETSESGYSFRVKKIT